MSFSVPICKVGVTAAPHEVVVGIKGANAGGALSPRLAQSRNCRSIHRGGDDADDDALNHHANDEGLNSISRRLRWGH